MKKKSISIGTGLVALDILINGNPKIPLKIYAGGSCGNVLAILSFLNWNSFPIARLKLNEASKEILSDLNNWSVNTSLITQTEDGSTPIIIQRIKKDHHGNSVHSFLFKNPDSGEWLPSFKPVLGSEVKYILEKSPIPEVFYFDRVSRSSIELAKFYKEQGAVIFFEPSSMSNTKQFEECLKVSDVIKFSEDRINNYCLSFPSQRVPLEIVTLGKEGLKYRYSQKLDSTNWKSISSYNISFVVDAAGSGDWFSAGIISKLAKNGLNGFKKCTEYQIINALNFGQSLGAINCFFNGARGLMYNLDKSQVLNLVKRIQRSKYSFTINNKNDREKPLENFNISSLY